MSLGHKVLLIYGSLFLLSTTKLNFTWFLKLFVKMHINLFYWTNLFVFNNRQIITTKILHLSNNLKLSDDHFQVFKGNSISPYTPFINAQSSPVMNERPFE